MTGDHVTVYSDRPYEVRDDEGNRYNCMQYVASGAFGKVYRVSENNRKVFCGKFVRKPGNRYERLDVKLSVKNEMRIHRRLRHDNVLRLVNFVQDSENYCMILEYCCNGSLDILLSRRRGITEPEIRYYAAQILNGLQYLHSIGIVHRDLKPDNVLLDDRMIVKIADFGMAASTSAVDGKLKVNGFYGTINYAAPEMFITAAHRRKKKAIVYDLTVDTWAYGCLLYELFQGYPLFYGRRSKAVYGRIISQDYRMPTSMSLNLTHLIKRILKIVPDRRPSLDEIADHPFFRNGFRPKTLPISALAEPPIFLSASSSSLGRMKHCRRARRNKHCLRRQLKRTLRSLIRMLRYKPIRRWNESQLERPDKEPIFWIEQYDPVRSNGQLEKVTYRFNTNAVGVYYPREKASANLLAAGKVKCYYTKSDRIFVTDIDACSTTLKNRFNRLREIYGSGEPDPKTDDINSSGDDDYDDDDDDDDDTIVIGTTPNMAHFKRFGVYDLMIFSSGFLQIVNRRTGMWVTVCPRVEAISTLPSRTEGEIFTYSFNGILKNGVPANIDKALVTANLLLNSLLKRKRNFEKRSSSQCR